MKRKFKKQLDMLSLEDTRRDLADDCASLTRVRSRLSRSSDRQLRTVIPALVPKLFKRLEKYRTLIINDDEDDTTPFCLDSSALSHLEEAKKLINGIIANAMEWLRGNTIIPVEPLVRVNLPFVESKNPVVGTWALAFLQLCFQRIPVGESSLSFSIIPPLLKSLGQLHNRLLQSQEFTTLNAPLEAQWIGVSWLLLDSIVLHSGRTPLIDWDMEWSIDSFATTPTTRWWGSIDDGVTKNGKQDSSGSLFLPETTGGLRTSNQWAIESVLSLVLDVLLCKPSSSQFQSDNTMALSPLGIRRMEHRIKINNAEDIDDEEEMLLPFDRHRERGLQPQFHQLGLRRRRRRRAQWSDSNLTYLRYMQLACFEFVISLSSEGCCREFDSEYAIVLSILFASQESMHGPIAMSYLKQLSAENSLVSLPVVTNVLVIIVGEVQAEELLDSFEKQYETNSWKHFMVSKSRNQNIRRPAINWEVGVRAADFLMENPINWRGSTQAISVDPSNKKDDADDEAYATLFIELSLKLSEVNDDEHKHVAMRLVSNFYRHVKRPQAAIVCKIFDLIIAVLTNLANSGIGEELRTAPRNDDQIAPGLVPMPFGGRNDLNRLLQSHRQSMKQRNLNRGNAIQARAGAYAMIPLLSAFLFERSDASRFRLPILLLQCAVFESSCLENCLTEALDSTLAEYKKKFDNDQSLTSTDNSYDRTSSQQQATFILPALVEAVCSGKEYVRMSAIEWIEKLLVYMDVESARYLAAHLIGDENYKISQVAKSILDNTEINSTPVVTRQNISVSFVNLMTNDGLIEVQNTLKNRSKELAQRLKISSCEESMALLLHYNFSVKRAEFEYRKNPRACQELCGLAFSEKITMKEEIGDSFECGICYDEVEAKNAYCLRCGHTFCKSCWASYLTDASKETPLMNFLDLRCPHHDCSTRVMLHDLQRLEPRLIPEWNGAILRKFIEDGTSYRYCPGPDCRCVAVKSNQQAAIAPHAMEVTCTTCTTSFCFGCGQNAHAPASCKDIAKWNNLNGSSQLWVKHHSKPCPGCNVPIEKNQGCNHMRCSHCNTDFCWLCLKILNSHLEPHTCNRYDSTDSAEDDFERQALFTFNRYEAHDTAAAFTLNQCKNFDPEKFLASYWFLDEDKDLNIMDNALKTLLAGREFLKNSYVAMLGLREDEKRLKLHEDHHGCLEMFTERLSQLTETNLHRLYTLQGHWGIRLHFRKLAFYTVSVTKYTERVELCKEMEV